MPSIVAFKIKLIQCSFRTAVYRANLSNDVESKMQPSSSHHIMDIKGCIDYDSSELCDMMLTYQVSIISTLLKELLESRGSFHRPNQNTEKMVQNKVPINSQHQRYNQIGRKERNCWKKMNYFNFLLSAEGELANGLKIDEYRWCLTIMSRTQVFAAKNIRLANHNCRKTFCPLNSSR